MQNLTKLNRVEMKNVLGGKAATYTCYAVTQGGGQGVSVSIPADNVDQAQARADSIAYSNASSDLYPYGIDCPGAE